MKVYVQRMRFAATAILSLAVVACGASENGSTDREIGFNVSGNGTPRAIGLPTYPGAKPYEDADDDSNAADIGVSTPWFGLKVVAVELETPDEPEKVAAFYRDAMTKYGDVLECSDTDEGERHAGEARKSMAETDEVTCDSDEHRSHDIVYKVGTKNNQRIVAIKPHRGGSQFSLVHVNIRDDD